MKKITSFLMMMVLCCIGAYAQGAKEYADKIIKIGTQQTEMVPGEWYFLHTPRNPNQAVTCDDYAIDGMIQAKGGLVYDAETAVNVSATTVIDELSAEEGVSSNDYLKMLVRFVAVEGEAGAYNIQFGNGRWVGASPASATCTNNQYIAGEAGKYNFYLPAIDGTPNSVGRFAWNKYNMANRVDNNGAGNGVVFWAEGEVTQESEGWSTEDSIAGNKIWEIFSVEVLGESDKYQEAFDALLADYTSITSQGDGTVIDQLVAGENVGNKPGNYRPEDVEAFLALHAQVEELMMQAEEAGSMEPIKAQFPTPEDLKAFNDKYVAAWNHMIENKVPLAMTGIEPGYYTFNSCLYWYTTKSDSVFYTQEEADSINNALVEEGYTEEDSMFVVAGGFKEMASSQVAAPKKSLYSKFDAGTAHDWAAWGTLEPNAAFLWKVEAVEGKPTEYRMINMWSGKTHISIGQSSNSRLELNDTATVCFDWRNDKEAVKYADAEGNEVNDTVVSFNIRSSKQAENNYYYMHCGGHSGGAGTGSWIVGWSDGGATRWYMTPVDEATANQWLEEAEKPKKLTAMMTKADSIVSAFPAQLKIAKDMMEEVVTDFTQFSSPYSTNDAQSIPSGKNVTYFLIDGNTSTYWHSRWEDGEVEMLKHYLQIDATEALNGDFYIKMTRRAVANDHPTKFVVVGYDANDTSLGLEDGVQLAELEMPFGSNTETILSDTFAITGSRYIRLYAAETRNSSNEESNRGYWHASELNLLNANAEKRYENSQYDARKELADALSAAIAAWEEKGFAEDSLELLEDETFTAAYNALVAAADAWGAVYVDPTALRAAIAAAPADELFVTGTNPGQWKEGVVTPKATVDAAEAYNASGAYTPAESEKHIAAIAKAEADVWAAANKIETGKWYRFSFPTEETYEKYGWDKTGAQAREHEIAGVEKNPALFGKTIAIGQSFIDYVGYTNEEGENDTVAVYTVEEKDAFYAGDRLFYFEDADFSEGEDLFRFIQATDSTYMIQNKATGLFLNGTALTAHPTYYDVKAIGAGANIIGWTDLFGNRQQSYLHGQRDDNRLVTWNATTLGSNSMMMIEEVEAVAEEPATEYVQKMWPGMVYTYTYPVDVTVSEGATAYGAELVVSEEDTTVVLKAFAENKVAKGLPFILIADLEGEYVTTADRLKAIAAEILAENEQYGLNEQALANVRLNDEFAEVTMDHGMEVDTLVKTTLSMRGTLKGATVEAGKGILAKENGFEHAIVNKTVGAYGAWIACDFDPESADVLGSIAVKVEGDIESGINEVLNKVAQSGKIYNAAGQLVGKGNINTVNNLPAGIYVVNGVKVIKK